VRGKSMRIIIATGPFLPLSPELGGAVEALWYGLGQEFARRGHRVTFLSSSCPSRPADETVGGVRYVRRMSFRRSPFVVLDMVPDMLYSLQMLALAPIGDVLVTNTFWLPVVATLLRRGRWKVVVNVQRMPKGQMALYAKADRLAATSNAVAEAITRECPSVAPAVRVIPNPVDTSVFRPPERPRRSGGTRTVLYAGRVHPEKGLHVLVDAFAGLSREVQGVQLVIAGPHAVAQGGGGPRYMRLLKQKAAGLQVTFAGPISDRRELARMYQEAHFFCYPSLADKGESFGVAPLEAMASGTAPVVSDLPCFRDFIEDGRTGLVFDHRGPDAVTDLRNVLQTAILTPELARDMGQRAATRAAEFSVENVADKYLSDFQELVSSR